MSTEIEDEVEFRERVEKKLENLETQSDRFQVFPTLNEDLSISTGDASGSPTTFPIREPIFDRGTVGLTTENIDLEPVQGHIQLMRLDGNINIAINNPPGSDRSQEFLIQITQDATGGHTVGWPGSVIPVPTVDLTADAITRVRLRTVDGGTIYFSETIGAGGGGANHNLLSATHPDTLAAAVLRGAMVFGNATPVWSLLSIGPNGAFLMSDGVDAAWDVTPTLQGDIDINTFDVKNIDRAEFAISSGTTATPSTPTIYLSSVGDMTCNVASDDKYFWTENDVVRAVLEVTAGNDTRFGVRGDTVAASTPDIRAERVNTGLIAPHLIGQFSFAALDSTDTGLGEYAFISADVEVRTAGNISGSLILGVTRNNSATNFMQFNDTNSDDIKIFKDFDVNTFDLNKIDRAEFVTSSGTTSTPGTTTIYRGSVNDNLTCNVASDEKFFWTENDIVRAVLEVTVGNDTRFEVRGDSVAASTPDVRVARANTGLIAPHLIGQFSFAAKDSTDTGLGEYAFISSDVEVRTAGNLSGSIIIGVTRNNSTTNFMQFNDANSNEIKIFKDFDVNGNAIILDVDGDSKFDPSIGNTLGLNLNGSQEYFWTTNEYIMGQNNIQFSETTTPGNPAANNLKVYALDDIGTTKLAYLDSTGTETIVGAGGGGPTNKISEGDSHVEVVDTGTGRIDLQLDGTIRVNFTANQMAFNSDGTYDIGTNTARPEFVYADNFDIQDDIANNPASGRTQITGDTGGMNLGASAVGSIISMWYGGNERIQFKEDRIEFVEAGVGHEIRANGSSFELLTANETDDVNFWTGTGRTNRTVGVEDLFINFESETTDTEPMGLRFFFRNTNPGGLVDPDFGRILFIGEDSANNFDTHAIITGGQRDDTSTSEDGFMQLGVISSGLLAAVIAMEGNPASSTLGLLGFYNKASLGSPVVQGSVTGSRGGNAALASLLTKLDAVGIIVDNSTA